jgi:outer membrane protein
MVSTPALSLGYYFDDDYKWAVEAFLLAKPLEVTIQGDGRNSLNGRDIIKLKMLPPTVTFSRYFGDKHDRIRPFVGVMGSYAIFYDVQATDFLNSYQGGGVGDTTVKVNNVLGWGGVAGLKAGIGDDWSLNLSVAKFRYKTDATITTKNTSIAYGATVLSDYGPNGAAAASTGLRESQFYTLMCSIAKARGTDPSCVNTAPANQGTFVRKASNVLDSTMFVLSLGRSF